MPQLDFVSYLPQMFWVLVLFLILFVRVTQGVLPAIGRVFWFREFKKLDSVADSGIVGNFLLDLFSKRRGLVRLSLFRSVVKPYFRGIVQKNIFVIKRTWLV
jgi:hypothetical protein